MPTPQPSMSSTRRRSEMKLGSSLRRAWIGYHLLLEQEMAAAGWRRRGFPDDRVLHLCARSPQITVSGIGRELGVTRQGASKVVAGLREHGLVTLHPSPDDGRERLVLLTSSARGYLAAQRKIAGTIEGRVRAELGAGAFEALSALLELLGGDDNDPPRLREFLHRRLASPS